MRRVQRGRDRRRTWTHQAMPTRALDPRPSKKEVDRACAAPDADGVIRIGHYNVIQVFDGTVVTIYSWTLPEKGVGVVSGLGQRLRRVQSKVGR